VRQHDRLTHNLVNSQKQLANLNDFEVVKKRKTTANESVFERGDDLLRWLESW
jgi:hypothetical protein